MAGRPSKKTTALMDEICERLSNGEAMTRICKDKHIPRFTTVLRWEEEDASFRERSTRARMYGTHHMAEECLEIADSPELEPADKRVRIDTRLRLIGKWNAKIYGDKQLIGSDPENPLPAGFVVNLVKSDGDKAD